MSSVQLQRAARQTRPHSTSRRPPQNPYAAPKGTAKHRQNSAGKSASDSPPRLISSRVIGVTGFLGGPIAGTILLAANYSIRDRGKSLLQTLALPAIGIAMAFALLFVGSIVSQIAGALTPVVNLVVWVMTGVLFYGLADHEFGLDVRLARQQGSKPMTAWIALPAVIVGSMIGFVCAIIFVGLTSGF